MRIYSLIVLVMLPLALRSCQPQNLPTVSDLVRGREVVTDSSDVIKKQGGYNGILIIGDYPDTRHGQDMKKVIAGSLNIDHPNIDDISIPEKNLVFFEGLNASETTQSGGSNIGLLLFTSREHETLRLSTRVVHVPFLAPFLGDNDASRIAENNILFVIGAGNTYLTEGDRDMWNAGHLFWQGSNGVRAYNNALATFNTGKVVAATSAIETEEGDILADEELVKCGDIAEWCFTVLPNTYTSGASARLSAMAFYLAQLYPTAEEIVETMNACAIDIGEPGIDREFGRGVANIICGPVLVQELKAAMQISSVTAHSPTLERMLSSEKEDCGCVSLFSSVSHGFGTTVGHVGMSLSGGITVLAGRGFAPIGVESSLFGGTNLFTEIGYKRSLFKKRDHRASLVATHSMQWGDTSANISRIGLQYAKQTNRYTAGVYAGYRHARIAVGLPGYKMANASKVSFTRGAWEMRFNLAIGFN